MKPVLDWIKAHVLLVVLAAVVVLAVPAMVYFALQMRAATVADLQKKVEADEKELAGARLLYRTDSVVPGQTIEDWSAPPNPALNKFFAEHRTKVAEEADKVVQQAIAFNQGPRAQSLFLVQGLFPQPSALDRDVKLLEMQRIATERAPAELLKAAGAGTPPDPVAVTAFLTDKRVERVRGKVGVAGSEADLSDQQRREVEAELVRDRMGYYAKQASSIAFYADPSALRLAGADPAAGRGPLPGAPGSATSDVRLDTAWDWQQQHWIFQDILRAIAVANQGAQGGVPGAVVKRLVSIAPFPSRAAASTPSALGGGGEAPPPAEGSSTGFPTDPARSVTGRFAGPENGFFDLRVVEVQAILSTRRIPEFINALGKVNFMSVLDVEVAAIDPVQEARAGYFYGSEHVSLVTLRVETVWLREWTKPHMPAEVRTALGIPADAPADGAAPPPAGAGGG